MTDRHTHPVPDPEPPPHRRGEQEPPHRDDAPPPRRPARSHDDDRDEDDPGRRDARQPGPTPLVAAPSTVTPSGARYDATLNQYVRSAEGGATFVYTGDGVMTVASGTHRIMKTSVASLSLPAPTAADEGVVMTITAGTAFAHFVQIAEGIGGKGGSFDVISFAAVGDTISLRATNLHWVPEGAPYGAVIS